MKEGRHRTGAGEHAGKTTRSGPECASHADGQHHEHGDHITVLKTSGLNRTRTAARFALMSTRRCSKGARMNQETGTSEATMSPSPSRNAAPSLRADLR